MKYSFDKAKEIVQNSESCKLTNILNVSVILHPGRIIETDIYHKHTNTHDYLLYNCAHPDHSKGNFPYNLAKRITFCFK